MEAFDPPRELVQRLAERTAPVRLGPAAAVEPRAQLALLPPGQRGHLLGRGRPLDHGQRLQHRVVQVRGDLRPLLRSDPLPALLGELAERPPHPRAQDQPQPGGGDQHGERDAAGHPGGEQRVVRGQKAGHPRQHQHAAQQDAQPGDPARPAVDERLAREPRRHPGQPLWPCPTEPAPCGCGPSTPRTQAVGSF